MAGSKGRAKKATPSKPTGRRFSTRHAAVQAEPTGSSSRTARWALGLDGADDDMEGTDEATAPCASAREKANPKVMAAVAITRPSSGIEPQAAPRMTRSVAREISTATPTAAPSASSVSSFGRVVGDRSSGYDTPETSMFPTPAEGLSCMGSTLHAEPLTTRPKVDASLRAQELRRSRFSLAPKRKWGIETDEEEEDDDDDDDEDDSVDAKLARKMQDEEYEKMHSANAESSTLLRGEGKRLRSSMAGSSARSRPAAGWSTPTTSAAARPKVMSAASGARKDVARKIPAGRPSLSERDHVELTDSDSSLTTLTSLYTESSAVTTEHELVESDADAVVAAGSGTEPPAQQGLHAAQDGSQVPAHPARSRGRGGGRVRGRGRGRQTRAQRVSTDRESAAALRRELMLIYEADQMLSDRQRLARHHPEVENMWETLAAQPIIPVARAAQPKTITRLLKPFQLEGLNWMVQQEKTQWKGGLLGDEMGMGKTIQAVSLIMSDYPAGAPTLVVVPPVAMVQWQNEIRSYTDGKLKVLRYHGLAVKKRSLAFLKDHDVIITSYSTLEAAHRKQTKGFSRRDEDDEDGKVLVKEDSPFHAVKFHRVILDEAHNIKTRSSGAAKACFALQADYKWCLSGTPLQNRIGELCSLLRFLEVKPFSCYMCKACGCTQLQWTLEATTRQCTGCNHRGFDHLSLFNLELLNPITEYGNTGDGAEAFKKLRLLLERVMLRRVKADHLSSMELPSKILTINDEFFGEIERDFASSIMRNTTREFDTYVAQGVMLNNYANIFGLLMQMRQVADHPDMILRKDAEGGQNVLVCCICDDPAEDAIRSACRHDFCRECAKSYVKSFSDRGEDPGCPRCHIPLSIDLEQEEREQDTYAVKKSSIINRIDMEKWTSSTKIEMLVMKLAELRSRKCTRKAIIFSQFTSMLQLVEWRLRRAGLNTVMLDGTMTPAQRQASIDHFMTNCDVTVFLVSLKAGGVALNLTEASEVIIVDPWWNPAAEWQSADRCHRIGQTRSCTITRLVIEDSVESRMVLLQEKKSNMIRGTINADESAMANLSVEDMQFLFRGA